MYREKIDAYIDSKREEILADVAELVRIDSTRGEAEEGMPFGKGPADAIKAAEKMMEKYGLRVTDYGNIVAAGDFGPADKALDILAHLDVVPVTEDWTVTQPFEPLVKDGNIYGRGTSDDKGPAIAALYAIRAIMDLGLPLKRGVRLILGSDEECGSADLEYYYEKEKEADYTFSPDADWPVINLEKARLAKTFTANVAKCESGARVVSLHAGDKVNVVPAKAEAVLAGIELEAVKAAAEKTVAETNAAFTVEADGANVKVLVKGTAAHGSTPELGINALAAVLKMVTALDLAEAEGHKVLAGVESLFPFGDTTGEALGVAMADEKSGALSVNLGILNFDGENIYGEYDMRAPLCATDENLTEPVRKAFAEKGMKMGEGNMTPAHYVPEESEFVQILLRTYEKHTGKKGEALAIGGGTYVHELERGVAFGCMTPEVDNHMHGDDEFMVIDMLLQSAKIFADVIMQLCG